MKRRNAVKILIIEDDKSLVETLKEILEQEKYFAASKDKKPFAW